MGNIGSSIISGMAIGTGSAVAHRAVDGVMGPRKMIVEHENKDGSAMAAAPMVGDSANCEADVSSFQTCMSDNQNQLAMCRYFFDRLSTCQQRYASASANSFQ